MSVKELLQSIEEGRMDTVESAWVQAVEADVPIEELATVLAALVKAEHLDTAETLGWEVLAERSEQLEGAALVKVARAVVTAVAISDQLRNQAMEIYRAHYADDEMFETFLSAAGLLSGQSPRRAFRTLDTCLAIGPDSYLANRFDHQVIRIVKYEDVLGEFEVIDAQGRTQHMEPKELADEFDPVDEGDFRVLCQHRPTQLQDLLQSNPAAALVGLCMSSGGQIDANELKERLVPTYLPKGKWSRWWTRARTAAKRNEHLSLDGRPITVTYHPDGRSLEEELAPTVAKARMPLEFLAVLRQYVREARARKSDISTEFVGPILTGLAEQAARFAARRPADALAASLAIAAAEEMALPAPTEPFPDPADILAGAAHPAEAVADLADAALWPAALDSLGKREDAADHLTALMKLAPSALLDEVSGRLLAAGREEAVAATVSEALANPLKHFDICAWLWAGPKQTPPGMPGKVELLRRLLDVLRQIDKDWDMERGAQREMRQRVRSTLSAGNYASYKLAVGEMEEGVAATIKNSIALTDGLTDSVREDMIGVLRENFYGLFVKEKVVAWLDETVLWTTDAAHRRRQAELKHLLDVKMLENANAIGAAAEHGDLSENSEWKFAMEERDLLRAQAARLQDELSRARVLDPKGISTDSVGIGCRVSVARADNEAVRVTLTLLGPWDGDVENHVYNYQTPLAQSVLGKKVGDIAAIKLDGKVSDYRIVSVESALS